MYCSQMKGMRFNLTPWAVNQHTFFVRRPEGTRQGISEKPRSRHVPWKAPAENGRKGPPREVQDGVCNRYCIFRKHLREVPLDEMAQEGGDGPEKAGMSIVHILDEGYCYTFVFFSVGIFLFISYIFL